MNDDTVIRYRGNMKPSTDVQAARCLYCGRIGTWWQCECPRSAEARVGKREKPKIVLRGTQTIIVLDAEAAVANEAGLNRLPQPG